MKYEEIIKTLAEKENVSVKEIEKEMKTAISVADIDCSPKELINYIAKIISEKTIYSI